MMPRPETTESPCSGLNLLSDSPWLSLTAVWPTAVALILAAQFQRVAAGRPGECILDGIDAVVPRGVVGVAAVINHGKAGETADRSPRKPHDRVGVRTVSYTHLRAH